MYYETHWRSVLKAVSYRFWSTLATALVVFFLTGELLWAITVGGFEVSFKMVFYFVHERIWDNLKFGRKALDPAVIWFTGLPSCGKTSLAAEVARRLKERGFRVEHLAGHSVRAILPDLGFTRDERMIHLERIGFIASRLESHGVFVCASFVSPYAEARRFARSLCKRFIEVYVSTPMEVCAKRDERGLYEKAKAGKLQNFTGVSGPYEAPEHPELAVDLSVITIEEAAQMVLAILSRPRRLAAAAEERHGLANDASIG